MGTAKQLLPRSSRPSPRPSSKGKGEGHGASPRPSSKGKEEGHGASSRPSSKGRGEGHGTSPRPSSKGKGEGPGAPPRPSSKGKRGSRGASPPPSSKGRGQRRRSPRHTFHEGLPATRRAIFPSDRTRIPEMCAFVSEAATQSGFDDRTSHACQLAVCEAIENIIQHGYRREGAGEIRVSTQARPGELTVEIADRAPAFDPSTHPLSPTPLHSDPPVGGRGLRMIRGVMDVIHYERRGHQNILRLTKNRPFTGA
ncbi:MAG TPA: ATP-binding protein [Anaerolineales bacterium]|nr:ATP-binding protein [Anaerolineales bacterium]